MSKLDNFQIFENIKKVTMSIVTYNSADEIHTLMEAVKKCNMFDEITVFVVDNNSSDNTCEIIKNDYPWVRLIINSKNLGFGKAHNLVIKNIESKYHIIVNPDILFSTNTIREVTKFMDENEDIVIMTPMILNVDGTQQFLPKKNPSMKYMIGGLFEKYNSYCKKLREEYTLKTEKIDEPIDVDFCTGAFMFTRTDALKKVNGFDERYFLHFEDADLTRELKKIGRAVYNPNIKVTHKWHRENKKINKSFFVALKSMFIYMKKWR